VIFIALVFILLFLALGVGALLAPPVEADKPTLDRDDPHPNIYGPYWLD